eukprot:TRINITY_DN1271_c0_g1_i1.p1 TRINITY_DN1271_c0_g1~~TRINITY_DN1271_c0_g1_i1.p1  ORF type:complete len:290 (-),score=93.96 TRINITY_DN1271_c0_g1_i1:1347-2216(-)
MEDRLGELKNKRHEKGVDDDHDARAHEEHQSTASLPFDQDIFNKVLTNIKLIKDAAVQLDRITKRLESPAEAKKVVDETTPIVQDTQSLFKSLFKTSSKLQIEKTKKIRAEFLDAMETYKVAQEEQKEAQFNRFMEQARIAAPELTKKDVKRMIENGEYNVFEERLVAKAAQDAKNEYKFITQQFNDLKALEANMALLLELFIDVQNLVEVQSESLEKVEENVTAADAYAKEAVDHLIKAKEHRNDARKRRICCCCVAATATAAAAGGVAAVASSDAAKVGLLAACIVM